MLNIYIKVFFKKQLTPLSPPTLFPDSCYVEKGRWYNGTINVTKSGRHCQAWEAQRPFKHFRTPDVFPDLSDASNFCRNPGEEEVSPWCYTTDLGKRWEFCDVSHCGE